VEKKKYINIFGSFTKPFTCLYHHWLVITGLQTLDSSYTVTNVGAVLS